MITTYNSKHDVYGNRRNLVVNYDKKEFYYYGCNAFNIGNIIDNLGIREVDRMKKELIAEGFKEVSHAEVRDNWRSAESKSYRRKDDLLCLN